MKAPNCLLVLAPLWLFSLSAPNGSQAQEGPQVVLPISDIEGELITVPVDLDGEKYQFILDSGATKHVFDVTLERLLGKPFPSIDIDAADGQKMEIKRFGAPSASICGLELDQTSTVWSTDLSAIRAATDCEVMGVLGAPLFRTQVVQLDFERRELRILPATTEPSPAWGVVVPIVEHRNVTTPMIPIKLSGRREKLVAIDTGYNGAMSLQSSVFSQLVGIGDIEVEEEEEHWTVKGRVAARTGTLASIGHQYFIHKTIDVSETAGYSKLGLEYWRRFVVTCDFGKNTIYLAPNKAFQERRIGQPIGLALQRNAKDVVVEDVEPGSPAERAGVEKGDQLLRVAEHEVQKQSLYEISSWLYQPSDELPMVVKRSDKVFTLTLRVDDASPQNDSKGDERAQVR